MGIDVKKYMEDDKLNIEFVQGLETANRVATIITMQEVVIDDNGKDKALLEAGLDFAKLGVKKKCLLNKTSLINLSKKFDYVAEDWIGKQVYPMIEIFKNNRAGVVLHPEEVLKGVVQ